MIDTSMSRAHTHESARQSLSVVVPVYNESLLVPVNLPKIADFLAQVTSDYEIIVVDNGSTDGTSDLVDQVARSYPKVRLVNLPEKSLPLAESAGFGSAMYSLAIFYPIDMEPSMQFFVDSLKAAAEHDAAMVIGRRQWASTADYPHWAVGLRWLSSLALRSLFGFLFWTRPRDYQSVKLLRLSRIMPELEACSTDSLLFDFELAYRVQRSGLRVVEVPLDVTIHPRKSRARSLKSTTKVFLGLPSLWMRLHAKNVTGTRHGD